MHSHALEYILAYPGARTLDEQAFWKGYANVARSPEPGASPCGWRVCGPRWPPTRPGPGKPAQARPSATSPPTFTRPWRSGSISGYARLLKALLSVFDGTPGYFRAVPVMHFGLDALKLFVSTEKRRDFVQPMFLQIC